jgi:hypothetical protein
MFYFMAAMEINFRFQVLHKVAPHSVIPVAASRADGEVG